MTDPKLSVAALLQRHAEWSLDQADPVAVRDLPTSQRERHLEIAREIARVLTLAYGDDCDEAAEAAGWIKAGADWREAALRAREQ